MTLLELLNGYHELLQRKDELAAETKENNAAIEAAKQEITQQMIDDDCPTIAVSGYTYSLQQKTAYAKRSDEELAAAGINFLDTLREEGLGDIIVERVDPRTLQSTVKAYIEENGELTEGLDSIIKSYDFNDISRRKITKKAGGTAK